MSIGSPLSPPTRGYMKNDLERGQYKEQRQVGHIHAEQKRRYMLQKSADYIGQLKADRHQLKEEMDSLRQQIECLNASIRYT